MKQIDFSCRLRALREAAGLSMYALAQRSGVSAQYIGALERGLKKPSLETARRLMEALGEKSLSCWD